MNGRDYVTEMKVLRAQDRRIGWDLKLEEETGAGVFPRSEPCHLSLRP
jgi:hypothetical protein